MWSSASLMLALLTLPLAALLVRTLKMPDGLAALTGRPLLTAMTISLGTTAVSMAAIIALGTPLAYVFARYNFPLKRALNVLIELPIVLPPVAAGMALLMAFGRRGLLGEPLALAGITLPFSMWGVIVAQVFVSTPFYVRGAQSRFQSVPREIEEAASIDGAGSWQTFRHVTLPLSLRGLVAGLILSWARALGEFGATMLFAGNLQGRTQTMPLLVYSALESDLSAALWASLLLILMAALALGSVRLLTRSLDDGDPLSEI